MCGITGYYLEQGASINSDAIQKSLDLLGKRGPDAKGELFAQDRSVFLGHRRLSIIDTSTGANQPMTTEDGSISMIFNGEIFNYKTLRKELEHLGYKFYLNSDSEVFVNLFHCFGTNAFDKINGFFAVAFYNHQTQELTLARDRFGIKPLYYSFQDNRLFFASEMKALIPFGINKNIDNKALRYYFSLNYIPAPLSIFQEVKKLNTGEFLQFKDGNLSIKRYYQLKPEKAQTFQGSYDKAQHELKSLMSQSVADRLLSDVPLGTFLSGGIDSSVVTALASQSVNQLDTFSVGFSDNKFFDETHYARLVAKKYNTNHHEIILSNQDLLQSLEELLDYTDEPFADSSALAVNALCKETKKHVTVCLSGDGADEVFGGYNKYLAEYKVQNAGISEKMLSALLPIWKSFPKSRNNSLSNVFRKLEKFSEGMKLTKKDRYWSWACIGKEHWVDELLIQPKKDFDKHLFSNLITNEKGINDILLNDIHLVLPNDMLFKVDSMSMRNSLEVRVPFLDYRVVEFAHSLPDNFKVDGKMKKKIVQDTFRDLLPEELYNRPKQGFEVPMLDWLKHELDDAIRKKYLNKELIEKQGIFKFDACDKLLKKLHSNNPEDSHAMVWALVVFQHWYLRYEI
jgi:asparagine synthase (glutamine-hydrolysing)